MKDIIYIIIFLFLSSLTIVGCKKEGSDKKKDNNLIVSVEEEPTVMIDQRDGRQYKIVRIGEQVWMAENLAYIPEGKTFSAIGEGVSTLNDFSKHFYVYGFDEGGDMNALNANSVAKQNFETYGVLYNWYAAIDVPANVGDLTQLADYAAAENVIAGIAPEGWHIPSDEDWKVLERYLGMSHIDIDKKDYRGIKQEGNKLKSQSGWETNIGTNDIGFGLVPNGRWKAGKFELGNQYSYLWSSTFSRINNNENVRSWLRYAKHNDPRFGRQDYETFAGYAIRCVKDSDGEAGNPDVNIKAFKTYTEKQTADGVFNVMTYNILWDKATTGNTQWSYRRTSLVNLLKRHNLDIIGIQEGFLNQVEYIKTELGYKYFGFGTDDGKQETDNPNRSQSLNPIMYNPDRLTLLDKGGFWYSDHPDSPNLGYSSGTSDSHFRNCVWGKFKEKDGKIIYVFNTHFSLTDNIREKQAILLMSKIKEIAGEDALTIIIGDFNSDPIRDRSYRVLTDVSRPLHLVDLKSICTSPPAGPSFNGSGLTVGSRTTGYAVDHVFVRNIRTCTAYKIIDDYEGDYYPSDHFPTMSVLSINKD